jgi:mycoredoxin
LWTTVRRWWLSWWVAVVAVISLLTGGRPPASSVALSVAMLVAAWVLSPRFFPSSPGDAEAQRRSSSTGAPIVYWRPGCSYCLRMRIALGRVGSRAIWVDVSEDPDASARVRAATGGNETVPTVLVGDLVAVNPSPAWVRAHLRAA